MRLVLCFMPQQYVVLFVDDLVLYKDTIGLRLRFWLFAGLAVGSNFYVELRGVLRDLGLKLATWKWFSRLSARKIHADVATFVRSWLVDRFMFQGPSNPDLPG